MKLSHTIYLNPAQIEVHPSETNFYCKQKGRNSNKEVGTDIQTTDVVAELREIGKTV